MLLHRQIWLAPLLLVLACLFFPGLISAAGDKKKDAKKPIEPFFSKTDELTSQDQKDTHPFLKNSRRKSYPVQLLEGKLYQFDLTSKDFDAVLRLENPQGQQVAFNDDAPSKKTLDARVYYKATATAEFKVIVTSLNAKIGKFSLTVTEPAGIATASLFKSKPIELKVKESTIRVADSLIEQDGLVFDRYFKVFILPMEAGKSYRIQNQSQQFDANLVLEDPLGNTLAESRGNTKLNAQIIHRAANTGNYRLIASTVSARATGKFVLEVTPEVTGK